jgi:hypothetical protein
VQVLLQADMIRELTVISDKLSRLENVERVLHAHTEKAEAELVCSFISTDPSLHASCILNMFLSYIYLCHVGTPLAHRAVATLC